MKNINIGIIAFAGIMSLNICVHTFLFEIPQL